MNKKLIYGLIIPLLAVVLVSAGILLYYGQIRQNVNVEQAVVLTGEGCVDNVCTPSTTTLYSPDTILSGLYVLTNNDPDNSRDVDLVRTDCNPNCDGIVTTYVKPIAKDDKSDWGQQEEIVGFDVSGKTLDDLFEGNGLQYEYNVLIGGTYSGASPAIAVIDLDDGRHIVLFPGWGSRTGTHTLTFSDTVASDTGGNNVVDFTIYNADFSGGPQWSSNSQYGNWDYLKASGSSTGGALPSGIGEDTVVTRVYIMTQGANTGEKDQIESMLIDGDEYIFIEGDSGDTFTVNSDKNPKLGFLIKNDFSTTSGTYTIVTTINPVE